NQGGYNSLKALNAYTDVTKVSNSRKLRQERARCATAATVNVVALLSFSRKTTASSSLPLNLLQLAPGGHIGRFVIWTEGAFSLLDEVRHLRQSLLVQEGLPAHGYRSAHGRREEPSRQQGVLFRMNPYAKTLRRQELLKQERVKAQKDKKGKKAKGSSAGEAFLNTLFAP
ncbi:uncharacterized protein F5147DRAFT_658872, partial [Suillus discolor]